MTQANENEDEGREVRRDSGATRRIVVQDLPPEELPRAQGRKLATPVDGLATSTNSATGNARIKGSEHAPRLSRSNESLYDTAGSPGVEAYRTPGHLSNATAITNKSARKRIDGDLHQVKSRKLLMIIGGAVAFALIAAVALLLIPARDKKTRAKERETLGSETSTTAPQAAPATAQQSPPEAANAPQLSPETPKEPDASPVDSMEIRSLSEQLAAQISQKGGYIFAPEFVDLIRVRAQEYVDRKAMAGARLYRREINKSFRDEGMNPLVGYALAMSRSKFDPKSTEKGVGIWQIPPSVARSQGYLGPAENTSKLSIPEASAQITATYTKALLSTFDTEDFMYAIACFGMTLQDVGRVQSRLINAAPDAKSRRDIMKIIRAGVLTADQVDSIARFFAAGIVGENPQKFGLDDSQPFSSLY